MKKYSTLFNFVAAAVCFTGSIAQASTLMPDQPKDVQYCTASGVSQDEWIESINIDGVVKKSGQPGELNHRNGYSDFSNQVIELTSGYITLTPGYRLNRYPEHWRIWLDLNQNGVFEDDEMLLDDLSGEGEVKGKLAIPQVTEPLLTRMRVSMTYEGASESACGDVGYGETEDYTVLLGGSAEADIPNVCSQEAPYTGRTLTNGKAVCMPDSAPNYLSIGNSDKYQSIAISTGHGSGNLSLYAKNGGWPKTDGSDPSSTKSGNGECVIIKTPSSYWTYITVTGAKSAASVVVDLGATSCRGSTDTPDPTGNNGYQYDSVNILVYRFEFTDAPFKWDTLEQDLQKVNEYYKEQSYGRFNVTYDLSQPVIRINESKSKYDNDFHAWRNLYESKIRQTGVDPSNPGAANIIMMTAPQVGNFNSSAGPPLMSIYHHTPGVVAHEMGHAMGLRHAKAVEAGPGKVIGTGDIDKESLNYGNVYSMMGMGAHTLEEYNLMYKSYFGWLTDSEVPLINSSGVYRIYAFDYGTRSGTNAPGYIGLKLKSGNGAYTYWVEYRTTHYRYKNTKNGVLLNLQGYMENEKDPDFWKHTSHLLDMTPGSLTPGKDSPWALIDQTDSELVIGKTYTDHWGGFRITPIAKGGVEDSAQAWIDVKVEML
ncbi:GEVED domain-containing protein [Hahella sp. NBU794]|uniref:GEVED domain-containing protein n=1 Tax=Hahella sp. NBU794 TaxID=3422590 RepID=UPI003D6DABAA